MGRREKRPAPDLWARSRVRVCSPWSPMVVSLSCVDQIGYGWGRYHSLQKRNRYGWGSYDSLQKRNRYSWGSYHSLQKRNRSDRNSSSPCPDTSTFPFSLPFVVVFVTYGLGSYNSPQKRNRTQLRLRIPPPHQNRVVPAGEFRVVPAVSSTISCALRAALRLPPRAPTRRRVRPHQPGCSSSLLTDEAANPDRMLAACWLLATGAAASGAPHSRHECRCLFLDGGECSNDT